MLSKKILSVATLLVLQFSFAQADSDTVQVSMNGVEVSKFQLIKDNDVYVDSSELQYESPCGLWVPQPKHHDMFDFLPSLPDFEWVNARDVRYPKIASSVANRSVTFDFSKSTKFPGICNYKLTIAKLNFVVFGELEGVSFEKTIRIWLKPLKSLKPNQNLASENCKRSGQKELTCYVKKSDILYDRLAYNSHLLFELGAENLGAEDLESLIEDGLDIKLEVY